jgi:hypothetical protein
MGNKGLGRVIMQFLSGILAGIIGAGGALMAALQESPPGEFPGSVTWLVIGVTGLVGAAKDWKTYLATPPVG